MLGASITLISIISLSSIFIKLTDVYNVKSLLIPSRIIPERDSKSPFALFRPITFPPSSIPMYIFPPLVFANAIISFLISFVNSIFNKHNISLDNNKYKSLNIINLNNQYTNLGLLLSDECPYSIKCAIYNGTNKLEFKDRKEFTGSVLKQVNEVFEYLDLFNKTKGRIVGLERIDTRDYPEYAIRESLLNAIIHRDYNYKGSILISLYDDHFEITSLGGIVKGLSLNDLYLGISESRNPNLANIFYRLKYVESFGTGIGRIIQSYDDYNKKPVFVDTDNAFNVTLYNVNYVENHEKILPSNLTQEEKIVEYLKKNNKINRNIVEQLLDISSTRAKNILNNMCENKLIVMVGSGKNIIYVLK